MIILSNFLILSLYKVLAAYVLIGLNMNFRAEYLLIGQNRNFFSTVDSYEPGTRVISRWVHTSIGINRI